MAKRKVSRVVAIFAVVVGILIGLGMNLAVSFPAIAKGYVWGHSPLFDRDEFFRTLNRAVNYYAVGQGDSVIFLDPHNESEPQVRDMRYLILQGVDGILTSPVSSVAMVGPIEEAVAKGIPVVTYNTDSPTDKVSICVSVSNKMLGRASAELLIQRMKAAGVELKGMVFIDGGDQSWEQARDRTAGMVEVFEKYPGLEIHKYWNKGWDLAKAKNTAYQFVKSFGRPLIASGVNCTTDAGLLAGLDAAGMLKPTGDPEHIWTNMIDCPSEVKEGMHKGYVDAAVDQPNLIYGVLSVYFLKLIKEKGKDALPPVGVTVISDPSKPEGLQPDGKWNIVIPGPSVFEGVDVLAQKWTPCPVVEVNGHRWIQVLPYKITPEKVDAAPIWSNIAKKWLH